MPNKKNKAYLTVGLQNITSQSTGETFKGGTGWTATEPGADSGPWAVTQRPGPRVPQHRAWSARYCPERVVQTPGSVFITTNP